LFILIGNFILEIRGMTLPYWIILFTTSCFANVLGLNISSAFNSAITIYILIPFIIIPQLLFSGVLVKFDRLHKSIFSTYEYVPVIGDMMAARWSFEALAVQQFKKNKYEKLFFRYNLGISQNDWYANYLVNTLKHDLWICGKYKDSLQYKPTVTANLNKLGLYIGKLNEITGTGTDSRKWKTALNEKSFNPGVARETEKYLDSLAGHFRKERKYWMALKDEAEKKTGKEVLVDLRNNYENSKLRELLLDELVPEKTFETPDKIIQKYQPVYMKPVSGYGRAHFYAPYKMIGSAKIDTFWFNIMVLWLVTLALFIALCYNVLQKIFTYFEKGRFTRAD
jgi:hypothetical protein